MGFRSAQGFRVLVVVAGLLAGGQFSSLWAQSGALSPGIEDIGKLSSAKVDDDTVVSFIHHSGISYRLTSDDIIYLTGKGVSKAVMAALLQPSTTSKTASPPPVPTAVPNPPISTVPTQPGTTYYPGGPTSVRSAALDAPVPVSPPVDVTSAPSQQVDLPYFQRQLSPYGSWVTVDGYGTVWRPAVAVWDAEWRPYSQGGHWVLTDAGWYWQADDPWGGVVFHYGRWTRDPIFGWVWVPGYNWAPSWVCWRHSPGYYGWAPLPPHAEFVAGVGLRYNGVAVGVGFDFGLGYSAFTFVGYDHLWVHDYRPYCVPRDHIEVVFRHSEIHNSYRVEHDRFVVGGFGRDHIVAHTGRPVEMVEVRRQVSVEHEVVVRNVSNSRNVELRTRVDAQHRSGTAPAPHPTSARPHTDHHP